MESITKYTHLRQRCSRRVSFHEVLSEATVVSLSSLAEEEKDQLWYNRGDIDGFRADARNLCRELRRRPLRLEESVRGLELRTDVQRQARKQMTIRCVLKAQRRYKDPRQVAHIYKKCSAWSTMAAAAVAGNDFYSAYDLAYAFDIPDMAAFPLPVRSSSGDSSSNSATITRKRASASLACAVVAANYALEGSRRVRRRTEAVL